jgi:hypothetical protein
MKAFLITLIILVVLAGAAFYFGWLQILLPAENYAVIFTKTGGYDETVVRPGEFSWRWQRLIPTNMTVYTFDLHPRIVEASFESALPSADLYSSILPENPDFSIRGTVIVNLTVKPESLPSLVAEEKLLPDDLDGFYRRTVDNVADQVMENLAENRGNITGSAGVARDLEREIEDRFPYLDVLSLSIRVTELPDLDLYQLAKDSYGELVAARDQSRNEAVARLAEEQVRAENLQAQDAASLEVMREYGKLLDEYPILLKALAVQQLSGEKVWSIPEFELNELFQSSETE